MSPRCSPGFGIIHAAVRTTRQLTRRLKIIRDVLTRDQGYRD